MTAITCNDRLRVGMSHILNIQLEAGTKEGPHLGRAHRARGLTSAAPGVHRLADGRCGSRPRLLRAIKNRFGATDEIGVFQMAEKGLQEVPDPSSLFLVDRDSNPSGTCILPTIEGGRPILVEVQALVVRREDAVELVGEDRIDALAVAFPKLATYRVAAASRSGRD